jgi:dihydroorotate dehydrogenase (fumarate)
MNTDISTTYMGLDLSSPIVAGSSGMTDDVVKLERLQGHGVGAVVLKSLFEEEIAAEMERTRVQMERPGFTFPETADMDDYIDSENGVATYLELIRESKKALSIPVIASINCTTAQKWTYFARMIEEEGADAIELNIFRMPSDINVESAAEFERVYYEIIALVLDQVSIPVSVKVSSYFTLLSRTLKTLSETGIRGLVLFNRFFNPDYDLDTLSIVPTNVLSTPADLAISLKWIAMMHGRVDCDLAASTGVHDGEAVIKEILAGACAVQIASTLYANGFDTIEAMNRRLNEWMAEKGYTRLDDFRGVMSQQNVANPAAYERVQFVKNFRAMR